MRMRVCSPPVRQSSDDDQPQGDHAMGATTILSEFASRTRIADISAEAVAATKRHILDCAGVGLAATAEPAGLIVLEVTRDQGGAHQARVFGSSLRTSKIAAAWANGSLSHLLDYDDTGFSHPTACILPAALAVAEEAGATGADLVAAVCVGLEVFERLSSSGRQHEPELRRRGFDRVSLLDGTGVKAVDRSLRWLPSWAMRKPAPIDTTRFRENYIAFLKRSLAEVSGG